MISNASDAMSVHSQVNATYQLISLYCFVTMIWCFGWFFWSGSLYAIMKNLRTSDQFDGNFRFRRKSTTQTEKCTEKIKTLNLTELSYFWRIFIHFSYKNVPKLDETCQKGTKIMKSHVKNVPNLDVAR